MKQWYWRQTISWFAIVTILFSSFFTYQIASASGGAPPKDDLVGHSLEEEMRAAVDRGFLRGVGENRYAPDAPVTRAQFATFLTRALDLPSASVDAGFDDVADDYLLRNGINRAAQAGLVGGYPGNVFKPEENISREQMAAMIDRALILENINRKKAFLSFEDIEDIHPMFKDAVAYNSYFGIIHGVPTSKGTFLFKPKQDATRAQAAAFIERMLRVVETEEPIVNYRLARVSNDGNIVFDSQEYLSFADAKNQQSDQDMDLIYHGQDVVDMENGIVHASPSEALTILYDEEKANQLSYVSKGTEMQYLSSDEDWVHVKLADVAGYVKQEDVLLIPHQLVEGQSYYEKDSENNLIHYVYDPFANHYQHYVYGKAPAFMNQGEKYYSTNGHSFYDESGKQVGDVYQYFNYLPLRTESNYTAEDFDSYIEHVEEELDRVEDSPLNGLGEAFINAQEKYNINAFYLFAKAIHESDFGMSEIAQEKKNLFGLRATDSDPLRNAEEFDSYEEAVDTIGEFLSERYLDAEGWNYNGTFLGNKSLGINVRYASDPLWGQKIAGHMYKADRYLGEKDIYDYELGITANYDDELNVRRDPSTTIARLYGYKGTGYPVAILAEHEQNDGTWYEITPDLADYDESVYVHGDYVQPLPLPGK